MKKQSKKTSLIVWAGMLCIVTYLLATNTQAVEVDIQLVTAGLSEPVFVSYAPGDAGGRLFVLEQRGRIRIVDGSSLRATPFLDIDSRVLSGGERGLLGLAFHPQYQSNGYFYVCYTNNSGASIVSRFSVTGDPNIAEVTSEFIILSQPQPESNHNGGMIAFGPFDGYLYIGFGDGGGSGDQHGIIGNSQDPLTFLGKMLRIDVDGAPPYTIPPDNPFAFDDGTLDEIWATGLRNPWRWSFDRETGDMYIADVGQNAWEEIDFESSASAGGINWGWRLREGAHCFNPSTNCDPGGITSDPIYEYAHASGRCSITGGYVYRGCAIPELQGTYFFADYCTSEVWSFDYNGAVQNYRERFDLVDFQVSSFGEDADGELYVCFIGGEIHKIVPQVSSGNCSGCCDLAGDADNSGSISIGDVTVLIAYIFTSGAAPECLAEGDADGSGLVAIGDVTRLISYIFVAGTPPVCGI
ncbi:PQQ-dependent sugar dehydrogenase [Gemmatimonas aurantiaca]|nr:PQQ-dependent sugar dehydrogenase [Gemmatimonas aurantiaca]